MSNQHFMRTKEEQIQKADELIQYFEPLWDSGHRFRLGLYLSMQWHRYLLEDSLNFEEMKTFVGALDGGGELYGSGFYELEIEVKRWLDEMENHAS